jgi:hypothetical protein
MNKSDLRTGMVVKDKDGFVGVVLKNTSTVDGIKWFFDTDELSKINEWQELDKHYNENLTTKNDYNAETIVAIYQPDNFDDYTTMKAYSENYLIWEREEPIKEVTMKDIEEKFGYKVKIIG